MCFGSREVTPMSESAKEMRKESLRIDEQLERERKEAKSIIKLLLLGTGDSGKSTVLKQLRMLYGKEYTREERIQIRPKLIENLIDCAKALVEAMETMKIPYGFMSEEFTPDASTNTMKRVAQLANEQFEQFKVNGQTGKVHQASNVIREARRSFGLNESIDEDVLEAIRIFWADPGVRYCRSRGSEFQLMDSCDYFMDNAPIFCEIGYVPNDTDVLMCRAITSGVSETKLVIDKTNFAVYDVGGQRKERCKWAPFFDDASAVIFVTALSAYDMTLKEDNVTNRMKDSINVFKMLCNNIIFKNTDMIVFLNKSDIFKKKIKSSPISAHFPDYDQSMNSLEYGVKFFTKLFTKVNQNPIKALYVHVTWATDTKQTEKVLKNVQESIIARAMQKEGLM